MKRAALLMLAWVALLWVLEAVDQAGGNELDRYAITPREFGELRDVLPASFMHFGWDHLSANTGPLLVLGFIAAIRGVGRFVGVAAVIMLVSGLGVWLVSPAGSNTAGASGVVFGLFGYVVVRGFVDRRMADVLIGIVVALVYGSMVWGALPTDQVVEQSISWQAHLFGLLGGVLAAFYFSDRRRMASGAG
ncbi:rhomboid family intramembrane serine protease [Streptomyces sp. WMMC500]|uniref:rhomboid family intramembrane serine protease n=1 Tax=Streptomyces sp. WMMC500 TaxID=3015154 RepID=UPI00248C0C5D|nr:rhomboid family intramembrane serine protease [Streptomyces sp. WMMC500]WBB63898.1 rhomboid family intramembrane serine protease [Streptomyces sp. WMMC500]